MAPQPLDVIIVGGSLAGLCSGIVLKRLGHNVRILERNPSPLLHDQGAGVVAMQHLQTFLKVHDKVNKPYALTSPVMQYFNRDGKVIKTTPMELKLTSWDLLYHRLRANFDHISTDYCDPPTADDLKEFKEGQASYEPGKAVTNVQLVDKRVQVEFETDGTPDSAIVDLLIAADGPSSKVREIMAPDVERIYAGYVAWRGIIPESEASAETRAAFGEKLTYFQTDGSHILLYLIPGKNGDLTPGNRILNWVWYNNYAADSSSFQELLTDIEGCQHHVHLPMGMMRPSVRDAQRDLAKRILPAPFAELVALTSDPFVQVVTDVFTPSASYLRDKVLFVGDALCGFRPHAASSTAQAAYNAMELGKLVSGEQAMTEYEQKVNGYAMAVSAQSVAMGDKAQFGKGLASEAGAGADTSS